MCGIIGKININREHKISRDLLENMLLAIKHRGPDESGLYLNNNIAIGSSRLSILDFETGKQPLADESKNFWIVFNGEIFNYIELRNELQQKGYKFHSKSDTEVIVAGYRLWGKDVLSKLNGQFAIAIWDKKNQELFLARDRVGICPLYYIKTAHSFVFGSEIKAILEDPDIKPELSMNSLYQVIIYWASLTPSTLFQDICEVSPGHYLKYSNGKITTKPYWQLQFDPGKIDNKISIEESKEEFERILTNAIELRLRADVPVAAYLSGGIDSTSTIALINKISPGRINTFSIGFDDRNYDETNYQKEVVDYFDTNHRTLMCNDDQLSEDLPNVIWHAESPMLRSTSVPMHKLSKLVRQNDIKVVITGEGADEILAGYDIFKEMAIRRFWASEPSSNLRPLLLKRLYPYIPQIQNASAQVLKFFYGFKLKEVDLPYYSHLIRWNNGQHILKYFHPRHKDEIAAFDPYKCWMKHKPSEFSKWGDLAKAQYIESNLFMSGYLLNTQGDRMTMSNSVEGRYPFLDHRLIEFMSSLPESYKLNGLNEKYLLKKVMNDKIPSSILNRSKQAYRAPVANVFFGKTKIEYIESLINTNTVNNYGIFDSVLTNQIFEKVRKTKSTSEMENMVIMAIVTTQIFFEKFILGKSLNQSLKLNNSHRVIVDN